MTVFNAVRMFKIITHWFEQFLLLLISKIIWHLLGRRYFIFFINDVLFLNIVWLEYINIFISLFQQRNYQFRYLLLREGGFYHDLKAWIFTLLSDFVIDKSRIRNHNRMCSNILSKLNNILAGAFRLSFNWTKYIIWLVVKELIYLLACLVSIHDGHVEIHQNEVNVSSSVLFYKLEGFKAIAGLLQDGDVQGF